MQVWIGYNQSLRPCQSGLTLNTDITAAAFLEGQPMLQLIGGTVGMQNISGGLNPQQVRAINKAVRGVQVSFLSLPCKSWVFLSRALRIVQLCRYDCICRISKLHAS